MVMNAFMRELLKRKMIEQGGTSPPPYTTPDMPSNVPGRAQVPDWVKQVSTPLPMQVLEGLTTRTEPRPQSIWSTETIPERQTPTTMFSDIKNTMYPQYDEQLSLDIDTEDIISLLDEGDVEEAKKIQKQAKKRLDKLKDNEEVDQDWLDEQELLIDSIIERYDLDNILMSGK